MTDLPDLTIATASRRNSGGYGGRDFGIQAILSQLADASAQMATKPGEVHIPYVLMLVEACRSSSATLEQLHVLNWAMRTSGGAEQLRQFLDGEVTAEQPVVRYEPALDRAISLATALGLLVYESKKWRISESGQRVLVDLDRDSELFAFEKTLIGVVGRPLTQAAVQRLVRREGPQ